MKRFFCALLCVFMLISGMEALAASCSHEWEYVRYVYATCDQPAKYVNRCRHCHEVRESRIGDPLGHNWEWFTDKEATCLESGMVRGTCTRCGAEGHSALPRLEHEWGDWTDLGGMSVSTCALCGMMREKWENSQSTSPLTLIGRYDKGSDRVELWVSNDGDTDLKDACIAIKGVNGVKISDIGLETDTIRAGGSVSVEYELPAKNAQYVFEALAVTDSGKSVSSEKWELYGIGGGDEDIPLLEISAIMLDPTYESGLVTDDLISFYVQTSSRCHTPLIDTDMSASVHGDPAEKTIYDHVSYTMPGYLTSVNQPFTYRLQKIDLEHSYIDVDANATAVVEETGETLTALPWRDRLYFTPADDAGASLSDELVITGVTFAGDTSHAGSTVKMMVSVKNCGEKTLHNVIVFETNRGAVSEESGRDLKKGASYLFVFEYEMDEYDVGYKNITFRFEACGVNEDTGKVRSEEYRFDMPLEQLKASLKMTAETVGEGPKTIGDRFTVKLTVENDGESDLTDLSITAEKLSDDWSGATCTKSGAIFLAVGKTTEYLYEMTYTKDDYQTGNVSAAFDAMAVVPVVEAPVFAHCDYTLNKAGGDEPEDTAEDNAEDTTEDTTEKITEEENGVSVVKSEYGHSLDPKGYHVDDEICYLITVMNGTDGPLDITVYDMLVPGSGELETLYSVPSHESRTVMFIYTVPEKKAGMILANQAAAEWTDPASGKTKQAVSNVVNVKVYKPEVPAEEGPEIKKEVITTPTHGSDPGYYVLNDKVMYRVTLRNDTGETWYNATVTDELYSTQEALFTVSVLAPGEEYSGSYDVFVQQPDVDQKMIANTAHVEYENGDGDAFEDCTDTIIVYTGEETQGTGDTCVRMIVPLNGEDTGYRVDYCAGHGAVYEQYRVRKENAATEAELIKALEDERSAWMSEIDELYEEMISGTKGKARSALKAERSAFEEDIASYEALLTVLMPNDRAGVLEEIDRALSDRCADLCYELHTAPEERKDVAYAEEMSSADAREGLDSAMAELWLASAGSDRGIVAEARAQTGAWLDARRLELEYLYPDDTGTVEGVMLREAGSRTAALESITGK